MKPIVKKAAAGTAIVAAIAAFLAPHEGLRTKAYPDPAIPTLATVCYGETKGVKFGDVYTKQECMDMLKNRIPDYLNPVDKMMPNLPDNRRIAYTDFAYNVGVATLQKSRIPTLEKQGKWQEACNELKRYVWAGGKKMNGLIKRREEEAKLCLNG